MSEEHLRVFIMELLWGCDGARRVFLVVPHEMLKESKEEIYSFRAAMVVLCPVGLNECLPHTGRHLKSQFLIRE